MSPSWREALRVEVGADAVRVRRFSRGWRPQLLHDTRAPLAAATAAALGNALTTALAGRSGAVAQAHVLLSGDWARLALLDAAGALRSSERAAAAAHALRRIYGDSAVHWQLCHGKAGDDSLLAAAIEPGLHDQLAAALAAGGAALASLQPSFVAAFNACLRWLDQPAWLVAVEPGRAVVCFVDGRQLRSLRTHRLHRALGLELPGWLAQQRLVGGLALPNTRIVVAAQGPALVEPVDGDAEVVFVDLEAEADGAAAPALRPTS